LVGQSPVATTPAFSIISTELHVTLEDVSIGMTGSALRD